MILCFELSMPYAASWNGKWSGADQGHYIFKTSQAASMVKLFSKLDGGSWSYRWDDGWCAMISARVVDAKEARKLRKLNAGFCGYDWMVQGILAFGEIKKR